MIQKEDQQGNQELLDRINRFKKVFSGPDGEKVLDDLIQEYGVMSTSYSENPHKMYFREGQKSVILNLLEILEVDPHQYRKYLERSQQNTYSPHDL